MPRKIDYEITDRVMPQSPDIESELIGAILLNPDKLKPVCEFVEPASFYLDQHQAIFRAMCELKHNGLVPDLVSVIDNLRTKNLLEKCGGAGYLASLLGSVSTSAHAEFHAEIIREKYLQRELIRACTDVVTATYNQKLPPNELFALAEQSVFNITKRQGKSTDLIAMTDVYDQVWEKILHASDWQKEHPGETYLPGLPTGFRGIDQWLDGIRESGLYVIAALTGIGKTTLALNIAGNLANRSKKIIIFSLEMSASQLAMRFISREANIPQKRIEHATMSEDEWDRFKAVTVRPNLIFIGDAYGITPSQVASTVRNNADGLELIVVDYIQRMNSDRRYDNKAIETASISGALKQLAIDTGIPVLAVSQVNREGGKAEKLTIDSLLNSGVIAQDSDGVILLNKEKESANVKSTLPEGVVKINGEVGKNRHSTAGKFNLIFDMNVLSFRDVK